MSNIYITVVRTGKDAIHETVESGTTVREVFEQAGIETSIYESWSVTNEDGDSLTLGSQLYETQALVCGARTDGA